jgi:anti-anti-sigma regulatory factor/anti-sigma regulatory factor (Ser/Thr protein kinase)
VIAADLLCHVERSFPVAVIRLAGVLDLATAARTRATVAKCLADQPAALVIDVSGLSVADDVMLSMFATLCRRAAEWPGAAVLLCAPNPALEEALRRSAIGRQVPVFATRAEAMAEARSRPLPPRVREIYLPSRDAPRHARSVVAEACARWGVPEIAGTAQVVVSELVANAVVHARTLLELSLALPGRFLHVAVRDGDQHAVRPPGPVPEDAERGRGLLVVGALAASWGVIRTGDGKIVWATLRARSVPG